jgi:diguanylate cyclase (GGDEF)-like protein/PAS domain S-box-containing protein
MSTPLRLIIPVMLLLFAALMAIYNVQSGSMKADQLVEVEALQGLAHRMSRVQTSFEYLLRDRLLTQLQQEITLFSVDERLQAILVADDQGKVLASAHLADRQQPMAEVLPNLAAQDRIQRERYLKAGNLKIGKRIYITRDRRAVIAIYPLLIGSTAGELRPTSQGFLYVQLDLTALKKQHERLALQQALETVGFWATLALLFWVAAHFLVTRRVALLLQNTRRLALGDYSVRTGLTGGDELGVIGRAFDGMAAQLGEQRTRLQQSKERLDLALKAARMITWETTPNLESVIWSDNLAEVLGGRPDDSARHDQITRLLLPMIKQCSTDEIEEQIALQDGSEYWLACRGKVYSDSVDKPRRLSGVIWDVTERHQATDALQMLAETRAVDDIEEFSRRCVAELARAYGVHCVFVAVFTDDSRAALRTLALHLGDRNMDNVIYRLDGTPCQDIIDRKRELIPCNVQRLYPDDTILAELGADSYYGSPLQGADGQTYGLVAIIDTKPMELRPWTEALLGIFASRIMHELERKRVSELLFEQKERAEVTLHSIGDAVITTDNQGRIDYLNPIAEQLTGWSTEEARGRSLPEVFVIMNEHTRLRALDPVSRCLREGQIVALANHTVLINRQGREIAIEDSAAPIRQHDGSIIGVVMVFHDVSQSRAMAEQLTWQATHDTLTGLINRREFEKRLAQALAEAKTDGREHVLLYLDLDQFKIVNDTCGHVAGDELLKQLALLLQSKLREGDVLARLGGDELGVLLSYCPAEQAGRVAENLRQTVKDFRFNWEGKSFDIGVSIGMVVIDAECFSVGELLSAADMACYAAKDGGRNRIHVYRREDIELAQRHGEMQWVNRLTRAIEEDRLVLYRQRILAIAEPSGDEEHYEVLIRLRGENDEIIPPGAFIPAAERYGLMLAVDRWVIRTLFAAMAQQARRACTESSDCSYAVNLSGTSLSDEALQDYVREQLLHYNIAPRRIWFEITETAAIANLPKATRFIKEMKALGCRFSLDDFGSGVSSFAYLKNLAVDNLKIDGSFVKDIVDDPIDYAMVQSINQIGHVMGLRTTAEFVENDAILSRLREIGVDYAQGYGVHRPEPFV